MSFVVGIAGGSGCGKTAVADQLHAALGGAAAVLHQDHYYRDLSHLPPAARDQRNFDHPSSLDVDLLAAHLGQLRVGRAVETPVYDFVTHTRAKATSRLEPRPVIVLEGILILAAPSIRRQLDLAVYLDMPADLRLARRLERDVRERGMSWEAALEQYLACVRPMHAEFVEPAKSEADLVIPECAVEEAARRILARLPSFSAG